MIRVRERIHFIGMLLLVAWTCAACAQAAGTPEAPMEATRDNVFAIQDGTRESVPAPGETVLAQGDGIDVDESGRALVHFEDLLTVEVLRDGELTLQELSSDEQSAFVTVAQRGGVLVNDFSASEDVERRFTVETEFATITATGTQFVVAYEDSGEEIWVFGQEATGEDLMVEAAGATQTVTSGMASSVRDGDAPSEPMPYDAEQLDSWLNQLRDTGDVDTDIASVVIGAPAVGGEPEVLLQTRGTLDPEENRTSQEYDLDIPVGSILTIDTYVSDDSVNVGLSGEEGQGGISLDAGERTVDVFGHDEGGAYEFYAWVHSWDVAASYAVTITSQLQTDGGQRGDAGDTVETATPLDVTIPGPYRGTTGGHSHDEQDVYLFSAKAGTEATIEAKISGSFYDGFSPTLFLLLESEEGERWHLGVPVEETIMLPEDGEYLLKFSGTQAIYEFSVHIDKP